MESHFLGKYYKVIERTVFGILQTLFNRHLEQFFSSSVVGSKTQLLLRLGRSGLSRSLDSIGISMSGPLRLKQLLPKRISFLSPYLFFFLSYTAKSSRPLLRSDWSFASPVKCFSILFLAASSGFIFFLSASLSLAVPMLN
jgi:hypothetical protein